MDILFKGRQSTIEVYDYKRATWSICVYELDNDRERAERLIKDLESQITAASTRQRTFIKSLSKTSAAHVIENPFALYYQSGQDLISLATQIRAARVERSSSAPSIGDWSTPDTLCRAASMQLFSAFEGFLNLVYDVYLKPELRGDRIADRISREQIDVKLRLAPIYCDCFLGKPIDHTTDAFRNFLRVVAKRNDFIHANITKSMKTSVINYEETEFYVPADGSEVRMSTRDIDDVKDMTRTIDEIIEQVLAAMAPRYRREFRSVMSDEFIYVEYENEVPVIVR